MFYDFPEDSACWELEEQYMFGPDVLVAPVLYAGMTQREVYLPKGACWKDAYTGKIWEGGVTVTADAPLSKIPVFLREGGAVSSIF